MESDHVKNDNDTQIRAGMTAKIDLKISDLGKKLVIPDYAFVTKNGNNYVYQIDNGTAKLIEVSVGGTFGSQVIVNEIFYV